MRKYRSINLGMDYEIDLYPIKSPDLKPVLVDKNGMEVEKEVLEKSIKAKNRFLVKNKEGLMVEIPEKDVMYKLGSVVLKHKPKFSSLIKAYAEVDTVEMHDLITHSQYFAYCPNLLRDLKAKDKSIKFGFTWGNGFAFYMAYIRVIGDFLVMFLTYPHMNFIETLYSMAQKMNVSTKEIEDNSNVEELINEQGKLLAEIN